MTRKQLAAIFLILLSVAICTWAPLPLEANGRIVLALALISAVWWPLEPISVELPAL